MRIACIIATTALALLPTTGHAAPFYGPASGLFSDGYKETPKKDGTWRIEAEYRHQMTEAVVDIALYRAAEMAREGGHPYVQILSVFSSSQSGVANAYVTARPTDSPEAPAVCRKLCYTADVSTVLRVRGGPSGREPGVMRPTSVDEFGRQVFQFDPAVGAIAWTRR